MTRKKTKGTHIDDAYSQTDSSSPSLHTKETGNDWLLSPHQFGWPGHRPRAYTILTLRGKVELDPELGGINLIHQIMRSPAMPLANLLCAPKDLTV